MKKYHKYIFNEKKRTFVGKFEEMYREEGFECFDSWHQEDMRVLQNRICQIILNSYNFNTILDVGCGKGTFSHLLKKANNEVTGIDISETAIKIAKGKYPDISFVCVDLNYDSYKELPFFQKSYDLILFMEVLSYLPNYEKILEAFAKITKYCLVALFIPENPIGFVKSREAMLSAFQTQFTIIEDIHLVTHRKTILFGQSKS
ncbi:MAG: class I SAM-dependent methyltransferase [Thermodesulfobacteriota bacterium]